jgi:hypothetical protein
VTTFDDIAQIANSLEEFFASAGIQLEQSLKALFTNPSSFWDQWRDLLNDLANVCDTLSVYILQLEAKRKLRQSGQRARQIQSIKLSNRLIRIRSPAV